MGKPINTQPGIFHLCFQILSLSPLDPTFNDPTEFEPSQEHKNVVLTRCRCAQLIPLCIIRTHKNDHVRALRILLSMSKFGGIRNQSFVHWNLLQVMHTGFSCRVYTLVSPEEYTRWFLLQGTHTGFSCRVYTLVSPEEYTHGFSCNSSIHTGFSCRVYTLVSPAGYTHWFLDPNGETVEGTLVSFWRNCPSSSTQR